MKRSWHDRLREAMEAEGVKSKDLVAACGVTPGAVTGWTRGGAKMIAGEHLINVAKKVNRTPEWIMTGDGESRHGLDAAQFAASVAWVYRNANEDGKSLLEMALETVKSTIREPISKIK